MIALPRCTEYSTLCTKVRLKTGLINLCDLFGKIIFQPVKTTLEYAQSNILVGSSLNSILYAQGQFTTRTDVPLRQCWETFWLSQLRGLHSYPMLVSTGQRCCWPPHDAQGSSYHRRMPDPQCQHSWSGETLSCSNTVH